MLQRRPHLDEEYFVENFVMGLKEDLKHMVLLTKPKTLAEAYDNAYHQEQVIEIRKRGSKTLTKPTPTQNYPQTWLPKP